MKGFREYLNGKPGRWIPVLGVPVMLLILYGAQHDGFQWLDMVGIAIIALAFLFFAGAERIYGMDARALVIWPLRRSLLVFGGSMYLVIIGSEIARADFEYVDLIVSAIIALVWARYLVWKIKRDFHPGSSPVMTGLTADPSTSTTAQ